MPVPEQRLPVFSHCLPATAAYFVTESILLEGLEWISAGLWYEMYIWWLVSVVFGLPLGVVGAAIRHPGIIGLVAGLTVPVGATVQMIWLSGAPPEADPALDLARMIVWAAAAAGAGVVLVRFGASAKGRRMPWNSSRS